MATKKLITPTYQIREFMGVKIRQRKADGFLDATSLLDIYNNSTRFTEEVTLGIPSTEKQMDKFFRGKERAQQLVAIALEVGYILNPPDLGDLAPYKESQVKALAKELKLITSARGKGGSTFMDPYLFVAFSFWLSPTVQAKTIKWLTDNLLINRASAAGHYKPMCIALEAAIPEFKGNPAKFAEYATLMNQTLFDMHVAGMRNYLNSPQLDYLDSAERMVIRACEKGRIYDKGSFLNALCLFADTEKYGLNENQQILLGMFTSATEDS